MRFSEFARLLESLENTSSRLVMYETLGSLFEKVEEEEITPSAYLLEGRLLPAGVTPSLVSATRHQSILESVRSGRFMDVAAVRL